MSKFWIFFEKLNEHLYLLQRKMQARKDEKRIEKLRKMGVKIGKDCLIYTTNFSTEPYLVEIGDRVGIAGGVQFITHNGLAWLIRGKHPDIQEFGRIFIGSGSIIGLNSIILPGAEIGKNCIIGAGSVVRGKIPDNSLVIGNPAQIVGKACDTLAKLESSPDRIDVFWAIPKERRRRIGEHFRLYEKS